MKHAIAKLKEAAHLKGEIARQEVILWKCVSDSLDVLLRYQSRPKNQHQTIARREVVSTYDSRPTGRYMNTEQAMRYLGIGRTTLYNLRKQGLRCIKIGKATRWKVDDLDAFVNKNALQNS